VRVKRERMEPDTTNLELIDVAHICYMNIWLLIETIELKCMVNLRVILKEAMREMLGNEGKGNFMMVPNCQVVQIIHRSEVTGKEN
jgi:hypothetical protein